MLAGSEQADSTSFTGRSPQDRMTGIPSISIPATSLAGTSRPAAQRADRSAQTPAERNGSSGQSTRESGRVELPNTASDRGDTFIRGRVAVQPQDELQLELAADFATHATSQSVTLNNSAAFQQLPQFEQALQFLLVPQTNESVSSNVAQTSNSLDLNSNSPANSAAIGIPAPNRPASLTGSTERPFETEVSTSARGTTAEPANANRIGQHAPIDALISIPHRPRVPHSNASNNLASTNHSSQLVSNKSFGVPDSLSIPRPSFQPVVEPAQIDSAASVDSLSAHLPTTEPSAEEPSASGSSGGADETTYRPPRRSLTLGKFKPIGSSADAARPTDAGPSSAARELPKTPLASANEPTVATHSNGARRYSALLQSTGQPFETSRNSVAQLQSGQPFASPGSSSLSGPAIESQGTQNGGGHQATTPNHAPDLPSGNLPPANRLAGSSSSAIETQRRTPPETPSNSIDTGNIVRDLQKSLQQQVHARINNSATQTAVQQIGFGTGQSAPGAAYSSSGQGTLSARDPATNGASARPLGSTVHSHSEAAAARQEPTLKRASQGDEMRETASTSIYQDVGSATNFDQHNSTVDSLQPRLGFPNPQGLSGTEFTLSGERIEFQARLRDVVDKVEIAMSERADAARSTPRSKIQIAINPPELGPVEIHLEHRHGNLAARISTVNAHAAQVLEADLGSLKNSLESLGIDIRELDVDQVANENRTTRTPFESVGQSAVAVASEQSGSQRETSRDSQQETPSTFHDTLEEQSESTQHQQSRHSAFQHLESQHQRGHSPQVELQETESQANGTRLPFRSMRVLDVVA